ncbi:MULTISPECIES: LysE family translocator [Sphingobium]|jgi:threonine/homoserine/homoserine lactone efflux protein|uniref:Amino acid transporter n=2 Tax=Sphingobium fuliginis (strain ATCC 27551) TaxID=336203 RepID=A0A292ZKS1_SPHSA|nr:MULTISPECIES: LysE family translocator [Sphingobium]OAP29639.1 amino acid transporter [Sphingobium sp. 20006FA]AJR24031.1 amino acid transporter [Sphingobium sp. YBL2]KXU29900.1 amino acid transporter [Sphingobium sp. AM]KYC30022.1 amino acid transporter [Sphingobium sp. 22B]QDC38550.1 LysE family translocator [Sphingobium fuliginis ATCC 27551]
MSLHVWWLYVTAVFLISATPGPNMLHVMTQSIHHGPRRALATMAGLMSAILLCLIASALGLGALLKASPRLFDGLRYAGVAYLIWLGVKAWRAPVGEAGEVGATRARSLRALYGTGLLTGLSNPKLIIFAAALFPQFIDTDRPFAVQLGILVASFVAIEFGWQCVYALGGMKLARWLAPANRQRLFNRGTGLMFIGFGGALLGARA